MARVTLERLTKQFGTAHAAVRDLSLDIADGELLVLVGPSGCGKSTVLRLIAGLELPTSGRVLIDDDDVTGTPPQQRDLAMVFQSYALYPHLTVRQNLAFGLRMRRVPPPAVEAAVRRAADMLGLSTLLDRKPSQLSGGQRQRVALGRALARDARVYLLDEPLSNLDPLLRVDTRTELGVLHRQLGSTMIYVTHDQEEAMTLGTRVAVLREGRLEQVGPPLQVYREPATRFVAGFIGSPAMNLVRMKVGESASGESRLESPLLQHPLAAGGLRPSAGEIDVGFRPHDMELAGEEEADGVGEVLVIEPLGPQTLVHLRPASLPEMRVRLVVPPETRVNAGDRIGFRIRPDRLHLFDPVTGARLP